MGMGSMDLRSLLTQDGSTAAASPPQSPSPWLPPQSGFPLGSGSPAFQPTQRQWRRGGWGQGETLQKTWVAGLPSRPHAWAESTGSIR